MDLNWLAGSWAALAWGGEMEEVWLPARSGTMLGMNRAVVPGRPVHREFMTLQLDRHPPTLTVHIGRSDPEEFRPPVTYRLEAHTSTSAVFVNPDHVRLSQIRYERHPDRLTCDLAGERYGSTFSERIEFRPA